MSKKELKELLVEKLYAALPQRAAATLRAINNTTRKRMLSAIESNPDITVTELYKKMRLEQSICSQHLGILREAGIVTVKREGKLMRYSINDKNIETILKAMLPLVQLIGKMSKD